MQRFLKLISNVYFWLQFVIAIVLIFIIVLITKNSLEKYTRHDQELLVPVVENVYYEDLEHGAYSKSFTFVIADSIYNALYEPGLVISQNPIPGSKVKPGRKIYLTIAAESPGEVPMPDLLNLSVRQAISVIESSELKFGAMEFIPSFDKNAVLQQKFHGVIIEKGTPIRKGSVIDIVVGAGYDKPIAKMPYLLGKSAHEAQYILRNSSLNIGAEFFNDSYDVDEVFVFGTNPDWSDTTIVNFGDYIDLFYTADTAFLKNAIEKGKSAKIDITEEDDYYEEINFEN